MSESKPIEILGFAGSARRESFNKLLLRAALRGAVSAGASCTFLDLRDYPLPVYDADLEAKEGLPAQAVELRRIFSASDGFLVSAPEYNGSISALLKNTIDWISRSESAQPDLSPYSGKTAAIMAASPGPLGGLRGLRIVRELFNNLGITVLPTQITLRAAHEEFSDSGELLRESQQARVAALGRELAEVTRSLRVRE